jgi:protein SCO1
LRTLASALALALLAGGAVAQPRDVLREIGFDQRLGAALPLDATFRDEAGQAVPLGRYFGSRPVVLSLVYYDCPMLCTLSLNGLVSALDVLPFAPGREFELVTVSFAPAETPALAAAKKAAYLRRYQRPGAAAGWHFLTGEAEQIRRLTEAVGFRYAWDAETRQYAHAAGVLVATPDGRIARYLYGVEYAPKDLRLAVVESSQGRVGSVVDHALLFCYRYDPVRGRYGATVIGLVRAGGLLTVLGLGSFVLTMLRKERRAAGGERECARGGAPDPPADAGTPPNSDVR